MGGSRWTWRVLALPGVAWLSVFFLVALYAVLAVAFGNQDTLSQPVPFWNPLDWNVGYVLEVLKNIWHGGQFLTVSLRTIEFVAIAVGLSLLIGYPVAYFTARHAGRWKGLVLVGLILPCGSTTSCGCWRGSTCWPPTASARGPFTPSGSRSCSSPSACSPSPAAG
jgi:ABC-type spermidine/putrescine transport system permease subunit I